MVRYISGDNQIACRRLCPEGYTADCLLVGYERARLYLYLYLDASACENQPEWWHYVRVTPIHVLYSIDKQKFVRSGKISLLHRFLPPVRYLYLIFLFSSVKRTNFKTPLRTRKISMLKPWNESLSKSNEHEATIRALIEINRTRCVTC